MHAFGPYPKCVHRFPFKNICFFLSLHQISHKPNMCKELFESIDTTIRKEQLYAAVNLMREDVTKRFGIGRHHLNDLLNTYADGMSFPQYINSIRMEVAFKLISTNPKMTINDIANKVGLTAPNFRELFKQKYGITPTEFKAKL